MVYEQKHIDPPMSLLGLIRRQGGRYVYSYFDIDGYNSTVFFNFYGSGCSDILSFDDRLDSVYGSKNDNRYSPICRSMFSACSRCLSSFFSRLSLGHQQTLADTDADDGQTPLSKRNHYSGSGRHFVPSQRKKDQRGRLLARCCPLDKEEHCLCVGTESGGSDIADSTTLGRRTVGIAYQHAIASQKRRYLDRTGDADDRSTPSMVAGKAVSTGCRRLLCNTGRKTDASNTSRFSNSTQRKDFRSAAKTKKENQRQTSQERQTPCQPTKDGIVYSQMGRDRVLSARQNGKAIGLYPSGNMVLGFAPADTFGYQQRPSRKRTIRFSFYDRFDDDGCRGFGMLQRPMGHRGYVQKHETVSRQPAASDIQGAGTRTSGGVGPVSVFDGVAVVSQTKIQSKNFPGSTVV
jgi:hypothetical protein